MKNEGMDEKLEPIVFMITDQDDLRKIQDFEEEHYRTCRARFPDFTGALFTYHITPTGLGTLYTVSCPCGKELALYGAMQ